MPPLRRWSVSVLVLSTLAACRGKSAGGEEGNAPAPQASPSGLAVEHPADAGASDLEPSETAPTVLRRNKKLTTRSGKCYFDISYPEVRLARDATLESKLNPLLRAQFMEESLKIPDCAGHQDSRPLRGPNDPNNAARPAKKDSVDLNVDFDVKLNQADLLSIKYDGLLSYWPSAHPSKLYKAVNVDLKTGEPISYESIWRPGSKYARRVDQLVAEAVTRNKIGVNPPEKIAHDFYLTRSALVVFNVFDNFALGSVEASIPLFRLGAILDPTGPLARLGTTAALESGKFVKLTADEQNRLVLPELRQGETVAHQVFRGPFGPSNEAVVVITEREMKYSGFVLVPDSGGRKKLPLPMLHDTWSGFDVAAVSFEDVDGDGVRELIVMAEYVTGAGPTGAQPFRWNSVVAFRDGRFVRLPEVEKAIERADTAAQVKQIVSTIRDQGRAKAAP